MRGGTGRDNPWYQGCASAMCLLPRDANPFSDEWSRDLWDEGWLTGQDAGILYRKGAPK